jgi:sugar phosphate isomerase/epimerase
MFKSLGSGAVGIDVPFDEVLQLAAENGFEGVHLDMNEVAQKGASEVRRMLDEKGLRPSAWGFTVDVQHDEAAYRQGLDGLPRLSAVAEELGCCRTSTWIYPFSNERAFRENFDFYVARLKPAAQILDEHDIRLGLEFVGPKTSRVAGKYAFVHTLDGMLELCDAAGPNVGLLLDSWHWYASHGTVAQLRGLGDRNIVDVHVNDAPRGIPPDEQIDNVRCMPGETGVIDIAGFLQSLDAIGYTGPLMAEPFSDKVRALSPVEAARLTADSMRRIWEVAGLYPRELRAEHSCPESTGKLSGINGSFPRLVWSGVRAIPLLRPYEA